MVRGLYNEASTTLGSMMNELERTALTSESWQVTRFGTIFEVQLEDGRIRYNVQVVDEGRQKPFVDEWFGKEEQARDFLYNKLMKKEVGT